VSPSVTVLSTGGTIASTAGEGGATPEKSGEDLVASVPEIDGYADITVEQALQTPSYDMSVDGMATIARAATEAAETGADGVVVTHGTDTIEESAYYLDLVRDLDIPILFTGAQRRPDEVSPDGPANLLTAVRAAAHDLFAGAGGVYVAFDEEIHAAREVTKTHTSALDTFESPDACPVAAFSHAGLRTFREPGSRSASLEVTETDKAVAMIKSGAGVSGVLLREAIDTGIDGVVLEGTGLGNATGAIESAVGEAIDAEVPVVLTSRCPAGSVAPVYGGPGGGETLRSRGIVDGGGLPAQKARLKLMLALEAADSEGSDAVRTAFENGS
jgi:L-asparaginase